MVDHDVLVVGGGISGTTLAYHAARAGRSVALVERELRAGGCLASERTPSGFWFELGAHTAYNSYGAFLEVLEGLGLSGALQPRAKPVLRFMQTGRVLRGKNLFALLSLFDKLELLRSIPGWFGRGDPDATVRERFSRYVGAGNYERVLGPMVSAVPSQEADDLPAAMLFKKRPRRDDVLRSFTLEGGLRVLPEAVLALEGVAPRLGRAVTALGHAAGVWTARLDDGSELRAPRLALALPPQAAAQLLAPVRPELASLVGEIQEVSLESLGLVVSAGAVSLPSSTFLIPLSDSFRSIVTRDVVPDPERRAFTFHFKPGVAREERLQRAFTVLGVRSQDVELTAERAGVLPALRRGHAERVARIDRALQGDSLALSGNWFGGLSIEDCALRSRAEWARLEGPRPASDG